MFTKKYIPGLCATIMFLAQSAAEDTPIDLITASSKSSTDSFIGISCGSRGNFDLQSSISAELSPACEITFLYCEHPELKSQEILNIITERLAARYAEFDDVSKFKKVCKTEIAQFITPTLKTKVDDPVSPIQDKTSYNLVALFLILDNQKIKHIGFGKTSNSSGGNWSWSKNIRGKLPETGKIMSHICVTSYIPIPSSGQIEQAQYEAERLQQENSDAPFHLVIDLAKWRAIIGEPQETE